MIRTKEIGCFKSFVDDVENMSLPHRLLGYTKAIPPNMSFDNEELASPHRHLCYLLLCSTIETVALEAQYEENKDEIDNFLKSHDVRMMNSISISKGIITCT